MSKLGLTAIAAYILSTSAHAAVVITAVEENGSVVVSTDYGMSLDLSGLSFIGNGTCAKGGLMPEDPIVLMGDGGDCDLYLGEVARPSDFGPGVGFVTWASNNSWGDIVGIYKSNSTGKDGVLIDGGYISGSLLRPTTSTYWRHTFSSLGMQPGSYTWAWSTDSITLHVVPIPAAVWLFGSALLGLGWLKKRKS